MLKKNSLYSALELLSRKATLLVPAMSGGVSRFVPYQPGVEVDFEKTNTFMPPKDYLFPQSDPQYSFSSDKLCVTIKEIADSEERIIFGIRPCDVSSIECMDKVFLSEPFADGNYAMKRENLSIIAVACHKPVATCFCDSVGVDPNEAPVADLLLSPAAGGWEVTAQSDKGQALKQIMGETLSEEDAERLPPMRCDLSTDMNGVSEKLSQMFDSPLWDEIWRPCLGCTICTYICPTCYCFDIDTDRAGNEGVCLRCWDSCMLPEYTRMAGGHNPRPTKKERVRNRYMHKLSYFKERYGRNLCTGCGRCLAECPVGMDIIRVVELVKEAPSN